MLLADLRTILTQFRDDIKNYGLPETEAGAARYAADFFLTSPMSLAVLKTIIEEHHETSIAEHE